MADADYIISEDGSIDILEVVEESTHILEVTTASPGRPGDKGDRGFTGPGLPIVFAKRGALAPGPGRQRYLFPTTGTIIGWSAATGIGTSPTGSDIGIELEINGVVVATMSVPDGHEVVPELPLAIEVVVGDYLTVNITSVGMLLPGEDLSIFIRYEV